MMIRVENLTRRFGRTLAIDGISFSIKAGEVVGFLGPNGAGKTTTMRVLACFLPPSRGIVNIAGLDVVRDSLEVRKIIGYMPEGAPLYHDMRVHDYIRFRAKLKGLSGMKRRDKVNEVIESCGLSDVARSIIGRLSKGYRQRVSLADSLVGNPQVLLLDEPTIGLDPNQIRHTRSLIKSLSKRHTVLLSTHILSEVEMLCDRVLIMNKGHIVASDTPARLVGLMRGSSCCQAEIGAPLDDAISKCRAVAGVQNVTGTSDGEWSTLIVECEKGRDVRAELSAIASASSWPLRELKILPGKNLEDVFVEMTREEMCH
ncbi:MAG: ATP-binding cassette domain-containing protein [bacterium]